MGDGRYEVGCKGLAEVDKNHGQLGAYCTAAAMFVPLGEVT